MPSGGPLETGLLRVRHKISFLSVQSLCGQTAWCRYWMTSWLALQGWLGEGAVHIPQLELMGTWVPQWLVGTEGGV